MGKKQNIKLPKQPSTLPLTSNVVSLMNKKYFLHFAGLFIFSFILYGYSITFGYVLDDGLVNASNKFVQEGIKGIPDILTHGYLAGSTGVNDSYRPLLMVHLAIEKEFFDFNPAINHFFNVFYYGITGILLFLLLCRLFRNTNIIIPYMITLLFMAHPVHTEVVANIKSRDEILCFLFLLLSLLLLLKFISQKNFSSIIISLICYFLALLTKENAITFLFIIPLILFCFKEIKVKRILLLSSGYFGMASVFLIIRFFIIHGNEPIIDPLYNSLLAITSTSDRIATATFILGKYILLLLYPNPLVWDYSYNQIPAMGWSNTYVLLSLIICIGLLGYSFVKIKSKNIYSFCILYFFITISVTSNLFISIGTAMAERFLYIPSLGFCIVLVFLLFKVLRLDNKPESKGSLTSVYVIISILLFFYSIRTFSREFDWKDKLSLYAAGVTDSPNSARTHAAYANELANDALNIPDANQRKQMLNKAIEEFKIGLAIYPKNPEGWYNLGFAYYNAGDLNKAEDADRKVLSNNPDFTKAYNNIGVILAQKKDYQNALEYFMKAASHDSTYLDAYTNLAMTYHALGQYQDAIKYNKKCIELNPASSTSYEDQIAKESVLEKESLIPKNTK